ncbi:MAG: hypothetical protein WC464_01530 [Bdellovibrionales bacterium]
MFSPDIPPPSKYRRIKPSSPQKKKTPAWQIRFFQIAFIVIGLAVIAAIIVFGPAQRNLVCDKNTESLRSSLISFGSCRVE